MFCDQSLHWRGKWHNSQLHGTQLCTNTKQNVFWHLDQRQFSIFAKISLIFLEQRCHRPHFLCALHCGRIAPTNNNTLKTQNFLSSWSTSVCHFHTNNLEWICSKYLGHAIDFFCHVRLKITHLRARLLILFDRFLCKLNYLNDELGRGKNDRHKQSCLAS